MWVVACGGPTADLARAREAYDQGDLYRALALARVVGEREDALSDGARAEYAYLRGMTDHRIAATLPTSRASERRIFRGCARRWLERALERHGATGGLRPEQLALARDALDAHADVPAKDCDRRPDDEAR
jgi:hypothetical protein